MSLRIKLAQLSLLLTLFVGAVTALPVGENAVFAFGSPDMAPMGDCSGGTSCST